MKNKELDLKKAPYEMKNLVFDRIGVSTREKQKKTLILSLIALFILSICGLGYMKIVSVDLSQDSGANVVIDYEETVEEVEENIDSTMDSLDTLLTMLDEESDLDLDLDLNE